MRELNEKEQEEVTGGSLGYFLNPAIGPSISPILTEVIAGITVQNELGQLNVRDQINPAAMSS